MIRLTIAAMLISVFGVTALAADPPAPAPVAEASTLSPEQLVENSAKRMLVELDANRAMYRSDPKKLDTLVGTVLLPNFDTEYSARLVLGQTWRTATAEQDPGDTTATVRTEVKRESGAKIPVNFSLRKTADGWKAWDVVIDGISYVKSFRADFSSEIQQRGLDAVITRLEAEGSVGPNGAAVSGH
jgi:phospholipid transport system substrate-binding protein